MLAQVRSPDAAARTAAEQMMEQVSESSKGEVCLGVTSIVCVAAGPAWATLVPPWRHC